MISGSEHEWTRRFCVAMLCCIVTAFNAHAIQSQAPHYMAFFRDATTEYRNHHFAAAGTLLGRALQAVPSEDKTTRAMILAQLGDVYVNQDDLIKAEDAYFQALSLYKGLSNKNQTAFVLRNIGSILSLKGRQEEALRFLEHALKLARAEPADPKLTVRWIFWNQIRWISRRESHGFSTDSALPTPNQDEEAMARLRLARQPY